MLLPPTSAYIIDNKILLYLAAYHNWEIVQWDFKNAFTHADIDKELYVE